MAHFDLAIIGVAIIESGTFGGTCLNVGCIPTKMYVYSADVANTITHAATYGIDATLTACAGRTSGTACSAGST